MSQRVTRNVATSLKVEHFFLISTLLGEFTVVVAQRIFRIPIHCDFLFPGHGKKVRCRREYVLHLCVTTVVYQQEKAVILAGLH